MEKIVLKNIKEGDKPIGFLLVTKLEEKLTKNGSAYVVFTLTDGEKEIEANLWNHSITDVTVTPESVASFEINCKIYQEKLSYEICRYMQDDSPVDITDFIKKAPMDSQKMFNEILMICDSAGVEGELPRLVHRIYEAEKDKLLYWGAAKAVHHNYYGGLLYHTLRMVRQAYVLVSVYPELDKEVLFCAAALHDIGKLRELETSALGTSEYTTLGNLSSHLAIGSGMISEYRDCETYPEPTEKFLLLKHCIESHHGKLEWGAISVPKTKEAYALFLIDMMDSKMEQFINIENSLEPGTFSPRIFGLETKVYRPN